MTLALRPYQVDTLDRCKRALEEEGCNRQLVVLPTAMGKTVVFANLKRHLGFRKRILVLCHRDELIQQAAHKIAHWNPGLMIGTEGGPERSTELDDVVVGSVMTLGRKGNKRLSQFDPRAFDAVISDEAQHCPSATWKYVLDHFGLMKPDPTGILSLGVTATPNRSDGTGLDACFDRIIVDIGIIEGIQSGYLCDLRGIRISTKTNLDQVHTLAGDFIQNELANAVNTPIRNALIVKEWLKNAQGRRTIVFTVDIQHAVDVAQAFQEHGIAAEAVWGADPDRHDKVLRYREGKIPVICNAMLLTEGFDSPLTSCIVMAKPTKSQLLFTQCCGRGTRIHEGVDNIKTHFGPLEKTDCLIMDFVDATKRHSLVTLSSLLGLPKNLNLRGRSALEAKEQIERIERAYPTANTQDIKNLDDLKSVTESASLFNFSFPSEIAKLTDFSWRKSADGYMLSASRDLITITRDLRDAYQVRGQVRGTKLEHAAQNLAGAFNYADTAVKASGIDTRVLVRDARWRKDRPSPGQIDLCRKLGIHIPANASKGAVSVAIDMKLRRVCG